MVAVAVAVSFALIRLDAQSTSREQSGILYTFGPEGARAILSAIAGSMITVAGLTFSLTMLTLQLASSQFGPRLLRNIMQDRGNQFVLGIFIATFVYCLLVLRTVRGIEGNSFVPHLSVAFGVVLAITSLAVLIYFIHHVATVVRVENLLKQITEEAISAIDKIYPDKSYEEGRREQPIRATIDLAGQKPLTISSRETGYVQRVDLGALIDIAEQHRVVAALKARPGTFVVQGEGVIAVYRAEQLSDEVTTQFQEAFVIGKERTPYGDVEFCLRRIVEVAQRVLSPGVNDPTTAIYCIDRLGQALLHLAERKMPSAYHHDKDGHVRVIVSAASVSDLASNAFAAIARYALADPDVAGHLIRTLDRLSNRVGPDADDAIETLSRGIREDCEAQLSSGDRSLLQRNLFWETQNEDSKS